MTYATPIIRLAMVADISTEIPCSHVDTSRDAARIATAIIGDRPTEHMLAIFLDGCNRVTGVSILGMGTTSKMLLAPSDILRAVLMSHSVGFVLAHNHPSGDPTPSGADKEFTIHMKKACHVVGLTMLDHIVVTVNGQFESVEV